MNFSSSINYDGFSFSNPSLFYTLDLNKYYVREKNAFCETCFEGFAPKCFKCEKAITIDCITSSGKLWHRACFSCFHCKEQFGSDPYLDHQGLPYHLSCYKSVFLKKCSICMKPLDSSYFNLENLVN
jgi:hypothetical protein